MRGLAGMLDNRTYKIKGWFQIIVPLIAFPFLFVAGDINLFLMSLILCVVTPTIALASHHKLASHEVAKLSNWFKIPLTLFGTIFLTSPPISWAALHKLHHTYPDTGLDPHSPIILGRWKALLFINHTQIHEILDLLTMKQKKKWLVSFKRTMKDPVYRFIETYYLPIIATYLILLALINPAFVIYFFALPMITAHMAEIIIIMNHGGFFGGSHKEGTKATNYNKAMILFTGLSENRHADHHTNTMAPDLINRLLWKISIQ